MWNDIIWLVAFCLVGWFSTGFFIAVSLKIFSKKLYSDFVGDSVKPRHLFVAGIIVFFMLFALIKTYPF